MAIKLQKAAKATRMQVGINFTIIGSDELSEKDQIEALKKFSDGPLTVVVTSASGKTLLEKTLDPRVSNAGKVGWGYNDRMEAE